MDLVGATCVKLANDLSMPEFDERYAKVITSLANGDSLTIRQLCRKTGIPADELKIILIEFELLELINEENDCWLIKDIWECLDTLLIISDAKRTLIKDEPIETVMSVK